MRLTYDRETDSLTLYLREDPIKESDEIRPGIIADLGYDGEIVSLEILRASKIIQNPKEIQFAFSD